MHSTIFLLKTTIEKGEIAHYEIFLLLLLCSPLHLIIILSSFVAGSFSMSFAADLLKEGKGCIYILFEGSSVSC